MLRWVLASAVFIILFGGQLMASNVERSKAFFQKLSSENIDLVDEFYDSKVEFQDPVHKLSGLKALKDYYKNLYENVSSIQFNFKSAIESDKVVVLEWKMLLKTPALTGGKEITVDGISSIEFGEGGKVVKHRDYFDMGEFIYERIPVLGFIVTYIKNRLAGKK